MAHYRFRPPPKPDRLPEWTLLVANTLSTPRVNAAIDPPLGRHDFSAGHDNNILSFSMGESDMRVGLFSKETSCSVCTKHTKGCPLTTGSGRLSVRWFAGSFVVLLCGLVSGCNSHHASETTVEQTAGPTKMSPVESLDEAIQRREWTRAKEFCDGALIARPTDPDVVSQVALVKAFTGEKREAALLLGEAAKLSGFEPDTRVDNAVATLLDVGELYSAIELLESSLAVHPENDRQRRTLVGFLAEAQQTRRLQPHLQKLIENRSFDFPLLISLTDTSTRRLSERTASMIMKRNPSDHRIRLADAFLALYRHDTERAVVQLKEIILHHPDFAPAHAMLGQALSGASRWDEIMDWSEACPENCLEYADYWLTIGDYAAHRGQISESIRAYWEATRRDPNRLPAWDKLRLAILQARNQSAENQATGDAGNRSVELVDNENPDDLNTITEHAERLIRLRDRFNQYTARDVKRQTDAVQVAQSLFELGRVWEAEAWSAAATTIKASPSDQLDALRKKIIAKLRSRPEWIAKDISALQLDFSSLPIPSFDRARRPPERSIERLAVASTSHYKMREQSVAWGLESVGAKNNPTNARLAALIRSTGVGGGAIDFDADGRPDLMMMSAGGTMLKNDSMPNALLRNLGDRFVPTNAVSGVGDTGFGQGVAVGDFNEDGFADLFVANLGFNRLLRNNGDGSFTDCTERLQGDLRRWSTSGSFVDVNGDAITDLLIANYCEPVANLDQACPNDQGELGPCHPLKFPADHDQFFVGTGDGGLSNTTDDWVGEVTPGRGLGIVSGALDGERLGIFVANDMSRNKFFSRTDGASTKLIDSASIRGVGVDGQTRAQASMGIASSDFDLDGDLDFYVTGFAREYNVYYEQILPGVWKDETSTYNLSQPTLDMIGFGTEAIDLDNNGIDEIIVTNGHIGDFQDPEAPPYELPLQIFSRDASGYFALVDDDSWGDYFRSPHVGRALWTSDVNRDGRTDVLITHSYEQVRLLINETEDPNHLVAFRLVATTSSRDAIGAVIRFRVGQTARTLWMLSGDGYFCSNEKTLIAGLGSETEISDVSVQWPGGVVTRLGDLAADRQYLIVQDQHEAFELHRYER